MERGVTGRERNRFLRLLNAHLQEALGTWEANVQAFLSNTNNEKAKVRS